MDRVLINPAIVSDIADAIREKGGTTEQIVVNGLGDAVRALPSGGGIADSTKELVNIVSGVTPTDELSLNNGIAKGAVDAPTEQSWEGERTTAGGGTIKDGIAYLEKVKGRSIKLNQLAPTADGFVVNSEAVIEDGIFILPNGSSAPNVHSRGGMNISQGHTYLFVMSAKKDEGATYNGMSIRINDGSYPIANLYITTTSWGVASARAVVANAVTKTIMYIIGRNIEGGNYYIKDIMVFDLTAMGKEDITTADQLAQYLGYADAASMPFIPYTPETIVVHSKHSEVVSKGRNLFDPDRESVDIITPQGSRKAIFITDKKGEYYATAIYHDGGQGYYYLAKVDKQTLNEIEQAIPYFTTPTYAKTSAFTLEDNEALYLYDAARDGFSTLNFYDICIEEGSTSHGYTPYMSPDTLPLPDLELRGVGTAQDEYTPSTGEVVRKMGVVDLGTLNWTYYSTWGDMEAKLYGAKRIEQTTIPANAMIAGYTSIATMSANAPDKSFILNTKAHGANSLYIKNLGYTDPASFKAAMQGVLLFYELAAPTTEQLTPQKAYYKAQNNGKEVAVVETLSAPFVAEIGYEEGTNAQVLNLL